MWQKSKVITIYILSIIVLTIISIQIGSELITQYSMFINAESGLERHHLADDMGFGVLLMLSLIPEVLIGVVSGIFFAKRLNSKLSNN